MVYPVSANCFGGEGAPVSHNIQPHGVLLVLSEPPLRIRQVSWNVHRFFEATAPDLTGQPLGNLLPSGTVDAMEAFIRDCSDGSALPLEVFKFPRSTPPDHPITDRPIANRPIADRHGHPGQNMNGIIHRNGEGHLVLELEPVLESPTANTVAELYGVMQRLSLRLKQESDLRAMCQRGAQEMRQILGFDRVMIYRFATEGHGQVIAESRASDGIATFLDHWFPDEDTRSCRPGLAIAEGRARVIVDAAQEGVGLYPEAHPDTGEWVDLNRAILRSPHDCHRTYLSNMDQVRSTVVVPLMGGEQLWGVMSCHHHEPTLVPYCLRQACEFLGRVMSLEISARGDREEYQIRRQKQQIQTQILEALTQTDSLSEGLLHPSLLDLVNATGVVISHGGHLSTLGKVPAEPHLEKLLIWLENHCTDEIYATSHLTEAYGPAQDFTDVGSGLLVATISATLKHYILWFRPETLKTVTWAKPPAPTTPPRPDTERRSPPASFQTWQETVQGRSLPWQPLDIDAAQTLRHATINIVLRQASEKLKLVDELARSNAELNKFAYITSHDLQEPLNLVANYIQLLEMRYQEALDDDAREFIGYAVEGIDHMQNLINDLLRYSRLGGQQAQSSEPVDLNTVVDWVLHNLKDRFEDIGTQVTVAELPTVHGNRMQLVQVFQNLLGNALKFRGDRPLVIQIHSRRKGMQWEISIADNGIGLDPRFSDRIFQVFQRLHTRDEYPGTGIGLAICKKIVNQHQGDIWVDSQPGEGATFHLTFPIRS